MNLSMEFARKLSLAYSAACKPLCRSLGLPQTAFDILLFLGNNPAYQTAADIVEVRGIKPSLVSVNVDRLVREGYLRRETVEGDRRKTRLLLTDRAEAVVAQGQTMQRDFFARLFAHTDEAQREGFFRTVEAMNAELEAMLEEFS